MLEEVGFVQEPISEKLMKWWQPELKNHANHIIGTTQTIIAGG